MITPSPAPAGVTGVASSEAAAVLASGQRFDQALIGVTATRDVLNAWKLLSQGDVRGSWPAIRLAIMAIIKGQFARSAALGGLYYGQARQLALGTATAAGNSPGVGELLGVPVLPSVAGIAPWVPGLPDEELISGTLDATGPWRMLGLLKKGTQLQQALDTAGVNLAGASSRLIVNGGREAVTGSAERDTEALGWVRVTSGSPCSFCAMLAGRGAVYKSEGSADFEAHNHCFCSAAPVFTHEDARALTSADLAAEWKRETAGLSGDDARKAWRTYWEARTSDATGVAQ